LAGEINLHANWKVSGPVNDFFMDLPIMKPKILDAWTAVRVNQPERAYEKFFLCKLTFLILILFQSDFSKIFNSSWTG